MKITRVDVQLAPIPAQPRYRWRDGLPGAEPALTGAWLQLETDSGHVGLAPCNRGLIFKDLVDRRWRSELLGRDPLEREYFWHRMWELDRIESLPVYTQGVVDLALWDLAGKAAGMPVWQLMGGSARRVSAYASTVTFDTTAEFLEVADQCLALGYPAIKLHAWGDARRDAQLCLDLRSHVGADVPLMYDGSAGFDLPDALYLGRALEEAGYLWYEEPMREFSIHAYKRLGQELSIPLLVAEVAGGAHWTVADWIDSGCATYVRTSTNFKAGFTGALRVAHLAESYHLRAEVHGGSLEHAHLCMALGNNSYYESLVRTNPAVRESRVDSSGLIAVPSQPGIGYEAEWDGGVAPWERSLERAG